MVEPNRVWKYSTIGLVAVLAVGFSFPQAFAHASNNIGHVFQHILDALAPIGADVGEIKVAVNDLSERTKSARGNIVMEAGEFIIAGNNNDQTVVSGHITISQQDAHVDTMKLFCQLQDDDTDSGALIKGPIAEVAKFPDFTRVEFNCAQLSVFVIDTDFQPSNALYAIQYQVETDAEEIDTDPS